MKCHAVTTLPFTSLAATVPRSGNSKACLIDRSKKREETLHDLTCHATVHRHMKTADVCHYANAKIPEISEGSSDQNIWDHLWKWSSYFGQPKFSDSSIFDKLVHHCRTSPHLCSEFGKEYKLVRARLLLVNSPVSSESNTYHRFHRDRPRMQ